MDHLLQWLMPKLSQRARKINKRPCNKEHSRCACGLGLPLPSVCPIHSLSAQSATATWASNRAGYVWAGEGGTLDAGPEWSGSW